jgi:hypothetical protein
VKYKFEFMHWWLTLAPDRLAGAFEQVDRLGDCSLRLLRWLALRVPHVLAAITIFVIDFEADLSRRS